MQTNTNRPQVGQPLAFKQNQYAHIYFCDRRNGREVARPSAAKGTLYLFPRFESFDLILLPPGGSKAKHTKQFWRIVERSTGYELAAQAKTSGECLEQTLSRLRLLGAKGLTERLQQRQALIDAKMPTTIVCQGNEMRAIGRGKYPYECQWQDQYPNAMIYQGDGAWCSEFCDGFRDRYASLDRFEAD